MNELGPSRNSVAWDTGGTYRVELYAGIVQVGQESTTGHGFVIDLPHFDDGFVTASPAETRKACLQGHVRAFAYFRGGPTRVLYDMTRWRWR